MIASHELPEDVVAAIEAGEKIEAIKLLRTRWNLDLKAAKDAVEAYTAQGYAAGTPNERHVPSREELPQDVIDALQRRRKIEAIKLLRGHWRIGLKEAKEAVEAYSDGPSGAASPGLITHDPGAGRFVALVIVAVALYFLYRYFAGG